MHSRFKAGDRDAAFVAEYFEKLKTTMDPKYDGQVKKYLNEFDSWDSHEVMQFILIHGIADPGNRRDDRARQQHVQHQRKHHQHAAEHGDNQQDPVLRSALDLRKIEE